MARTCKDHLRVHTPGLAAGLLINRKEGLIQELKEFLKNKVSSYKVPAIIVFVSSLPKTTTGKVLRYKLRDKGGCNERGIFSGI